MKHEKLSRTVLRITLSFLLLTFTSLLHAQNPLSISGLVTDSTGEPLIGATLAVKGTRTATATDIDGNFTLSPVKSGDVITVTYIGYAPREITVTNSTQPLKIVLDSSTSDLDEVVVVGYGTQKKVNLTGSVSTISADELASRPVTNTSTAIAGLAPGISVIQNSGLPGA